MNRHLFLLAICLAVSVAIAAENQQDTSSPGETFPPATESEAAKDDLEAVESAAGRLLELVADQTRDPDTLAVVAAEIVSSGDDCPEQLEAECDLDGDPEPDVDTDTAIDTNKPESPTPGLELQ